MRLWYVVGDKEYWLECEYQVGRNGYPRILGCKIYDPQNKYVGYWAEQLIPTKVKADLREQIKAFEKRVAAQIKAEGKILRSLRR